MFFHGLPATIRLLRGSTFFTDPRLNLHELTYSGRKPMGNGHHRMLDESASKVNPFDKLRIDPESIEGSIYGNPIMSLNLAQ